MSIKILIIYLFIFQINFIFSMKILKKIKYALFADQYMADLVNACHANNIERVRDLLLNQKVKNVNYEYGFTNNPLQIAIDNNYIEIVKVLLSYSENINFRIKINRFDDEYTLLTLATLKKFYEIVLLLLQNGADVNAQDQYGETALVVSLEKGYKKIAKILLEYGADPNVSTNGEPL